MRTVKWLIRRAVYTFDNCKLFSRDENGSKSTARRQHIRYRSSHSVEVAVIIDVAQLAVIR